MKILKVTNFWDAEKSIFKTLKGDERDKQISTRKVFLKIRILFSAANMREYSPKAKKGNIKRRFLELVF